MVQVAQGGDERVGSPLLADDFLGGAANHHVLAKTVDIEILPDVGFVGFEFDEAAVGLHLLDGGHLPLHDFLGVGVVVEEDGLHLDGSHVAFLQVVEGVLGVVVAGELGRNLVGAPEQVVHLLPVVQAEDVLAPWVDEILVYVVHLVVQDNVPHPQLPVIGEVFTVAVDIVQNLQQLFLVLGCMLEWEL